MGVVGVEAESCRCDWRVAQGSNVRLCVPAELSAVSVAQRTALPHCASRTVGHTNTTRSRRQILLCQK